MTTAHDLAADVNALAEEIRALARRLDAAVAVQWQAPPVPRPRDDTTERSKGAPPSNPTADTALDDRRLALRSAVRGGQQSIRLATASVPAATSRLDAALVAFEGDPEA